MLRFYALGFAAISPFPVMLCTPVCLSLCLSVCRSQRQIVVEETIGCCLRLWKTCGCSYLAYTASSLTFDISFKTVCVFGPAIIRQALIGAGLENTYVLS